MINSVERQVQTESAYDAHGVNTVKVTSCALGSFAGDVLVEALATAFFHAFKNESHVHREFKAESVMGFQDVEPAQYRAFIVCSSSPKHLAQPLIDM